ncbi:MAG: hypothetical protein EHM35_02925 [Planctomycetaceae bacterium]|nr:MAG: hypothetical protein EHM35_02925 [Planctomycetaceae bacterium]
MYADVWPGVTVGFAATADGLAESTYTLQPGARPADIRLSYNTPVQLMPDGMLRLAFESGYISESAPVAYQDVAGRRIPVPVHFAVKKGIVGFEVGAYDPAYALTIDPTYTWHTFYGSSTEDYGTAIARDGSGNIYVGGYGNDTWNGPSGQLPLHARTSTSPADIVVVKLSSAGAYLWHTFYGSSSQDDGVSITADGSGNVYVTGNSEASWDGPGTCTTPGDSPWPLHTHSGGVDIVVFKLSSAGAYLWHTFYGSSTWDEGDGITADGSGNVYVTATSSASWNGPGTCSTPGVSPCPLHAQAGMEDNVVIKLSSAGTYLWHTFYGSTNEETANGIAVDGDGNVYVAGVSYDSWDGPSGQSPLHAFTNPGAVIGDIAIIKLNSAGAYEWHTFYGSAGEDYAGAITAAMSGSIYVAGYSFASWDGPGTCTTPGVSPCPLHAYASSYDIFVLKQSELPPTTTLSSSSNPSTYGQSITFTATVTATIGTPTGTVQFYADGSPLGAPMALSSGKAVTSLASLTFGTHAITATYSGNADYLGSTSVAISQSVEKKTVTGNITASDKVYDGTTAATITGRTLTGVVTGDDVSLSGGTATFADRHAGSKSVTASGLSLSGTAAGNYQLASTSAMTTASITPAALTVTANDATKVYGAALPTFSASYSAFVSGENESALGGELTFNTTATSTSNAGNYDVTPQGLTSNNYAITFKKGTLTITKATTTATLQLSPGPVTFGLPVTLTLTVSPVVTVTGEITGTVTFMEGSTVLGTAEIVYIGSSFEAKLVTSSLAVGNHNLSASYGGNNNFAASSSNVISLIVLTGDTTNKIYLPITRK